MSEPQQKNCRPAETKQENHTNMKGQHNLPSQQLIPSAVSLSLDTKQTQEIKEQTLHPYLAQYKMFSSENWKIFEKLQAEYPQQAIVLHLQIMKASSKYYEHFKQLSLNEMDNVINLLRKTYEKGFPRGLGTILVLKAQIQRLTRIRNSEASNLLSIIKRATKSIFNCLPSLESFKKGGSSNPDIEENENLISK